ncbi:MalY/PatB family protein, partial [Miniimonas arenae]|uniref:MalY/PatB family protein n=1 Tax=Miniimonas arenae TaxID=676201 RepID=UPI0028AD5DBB
MAAFDATTAEELRARGSLKWTRFPQALGLWVAEMDLPLAPPVAQALHRAVDMPFIGYLSAEAKAAAREACAAWYARATGWSPDPARIHLMTDVLHSLDLLLGQVLPAGTETVVVTPAYMPFLYRPRVLERPFVTAPARQDEDGTYRVDLDALDGALRGGGRLLVLCNPWNPVGRVLTEVELREVAAVVEANDALVFADEIHAPLVYDGVGHVPYASLSDATAAHSVTATAASKAWNLAGLKCSALVATHDDVHERLLDLAPVLSDDPGTLGVVAMAAAYDDGEPFLRETLAYLDKNRAALADALARELPSARHTPPEGTYLAWVDLRGVRTGSGEELPEDLVTFFRERAGVALQDGAACGAPGFVRLNIALPQPILLDAVRAMAAAVAAAASF